jgi:hypothetical protein
MEKCFWDLLDEDLVEHISIHQCDSAKEWIFFHIESLSHSEFIKVVVTIFASWSSRRKAINESIFQNPLSTYHFNLNFLEELDMIKLKKPSSSSSSHEGRTKGLEDWCGLLHHQGISKSMSMVLSQEGRRGSAAAICRDENGIYQGASAITTLEISDPGTIEAIACHEALCLASNLHLWCLFIASDCLEVTNSIRDSTSSLFSTIIGEFFLHRHHFDLVIFVHENKSSNTHAHNLAHSSLNCITGHHLWLIHSPDELIVPYVIHD